MAFGGDDDIKITLSLEADGVVKELKLVGESLEKIERASGSADGPVKGLESSFSSFGAKLISLNQGLDLATRAFSIVKDVAGTAIGVIQRGAEVGDVAESFERLSAAAGVTASTFQNQLVKATGETISNFDLQKKAIESLRAGVKPDEFITLTQAARALAEQTGGDTKEAIEELSTAFETGRVRALQNKLGIIDLDAAETGYAQKLGITREALTEQQRVLAARNALLDASRQKIQEVGEIEADAADNVATLGRSLDNLKDAFSQAVSGNAELNLAISELTGLIRQADFTPLIKALSSIVSVGSLAIKALVDLGEALGLALAEAGANASVKIEQLKKGLNELRNGGVAPAQQALSDLSPTIGEVFDETTLLSGALKAAETRLTSVSKPTQSASTGLKGLETATKNVAKTAKSSEKDIEAWADALGVSAVAAYQTTFSVEQLRGAIESLNSSQSSSSGLSSNLSDSFTKFVSGDISGLLDKIKEVGDQIENALANAIGDGLRLALDGGNSADYKELSKKLGSDIGGSIGGALGGPIGAQIGSVFGEKIGKAAFDALNSVFGGRDKQGKVRDSLDKFLAELLTDNPALINFEGQLKKIFDLEFLKGSNAFVDGTFDDTLQSLSTSAQATFSGLALAFSQFVEGASDQSGQLAAILANNLGGSLNNLQLFVQATGISFEKLREQIVEAFLDGKLTADEALNSLSSIQQISEKGIPGAIGAVDQAFNNLKASGEKGGRAIIDALQDIGSEARELGIKDFATLANVIREKTGASAEEVQKLFDALAAAGITSIDQLEKATVEQLLPAISNLSKADFPFAEAADSVQGLIDQVNKLPDRIEKKLVFNVETRADRTSQQLIDKGAIPQFGNAGEGT